jgi:hypothetical protein
MDFLDPAKKRQHKIRLLVGYFLVAIAILTLAYLLILQSYGYDYDRHTGQIIQNGLVYTSSHPTSADVYVNGQLKGSTNLKLNIPAGNYDIVLKSRGYRDWQTTINLDGGSIVQLNYPLLVPNKLTSTEVRLYDQNPAFASPSLDRHWLLVPQVGSLTGFDIYDITKPSLPPAVISLPTELLKPAIGAQSIKVVEWSSDNRHILLQHDYDGGPEFIVMDRQNPSLSYNVNSAANVEPTSVVLRDKKFDQFYAYIAKTHSLLTFNAANKQVSTVLKNVIDYKDNGPNTVLYTSDVSKVAGQYSVNIWDGQKSYLLHNYIANTVYKLDMASYSGHTYVAVMPAATNRLYVYKDPLTIMKAGRVPNPFIALKITDPQFVSFSATARFVVAQSGPSFAAYDFEENLWHYFTLKDKVPVTDKAEWIDGHRLILNINGKLNLFDFNGDNQRVLVPAQATFNGYFNSDYSSVFTIADSSQAAGKSALTRTSMVVP